MKKKSLSVALFFLAGLCGSRVEAADWYYDHWCGDGLQFLDDSKCAKDFPTVFSRDWTCPITPLASPPEGFLPDSADLTLQAVDTTALSQIITSSDVNACVIITKRVVDKGSETGVRLFHKYFCSGEWSKDTPVETWSSSKIFAMANAAGRLRTNESRCGEENALFGLDGAVQGKHGRTPLGDLSTVVCSYDSTAGYSSNSLSSYFHDLGWRQRAHDLVSGESWLNEKSQSLGGNYGESTPSDLGFTVFSAASDNGSENESCAVDKDPRPFVYSNSLSSLSAAELTRRIVHFRESSEALRFPGSKWEDMQAILYGAQESVLFPGLQWGGMTADTAIFLQSASKMKSLLQETDKHRNLWRIFSKLGAGYSSSRSRGEIVTNAHACVPLFDANKSTAVNGYEFSISVRSSVPNDAALNRAQTLVMDAVEKIVDFVIGSF